MTDDHGLSPFVDRCCDALDRYSLLLAAGYPHDLAMRKSGLYEAVTGQPMPESVTEPFDPKQAQAGRDE